jgi:hypothetical protein
LLGTLEKIGSFFAKDRRKPLPQRMVVIGTHLDNGLAVALKAQIVLGENTLPDVEIFLDRIHLGEPYCPTCKRPLDKLRASWMADCGHIGYECKTCETEIQKFPAALHNDALGAVRRGYLSLWERYENEIRDLTKGKPKKYMLPE